MSVLGLDLITVGRTEHILIILFGDFILPDCSPHELELLIDTCLRDDEMQEWSLQQKVLH